jgi:hypothetical protein
VVPENSPRCGCRIRLARFVGITEPPITPDGGQPNAAVETIATIAVGGTTACRCRHGQISTTLTANVAMERAPSSVRARCPYHRQLLRD